MKWLLAVAHEPAAWRSPDIAYLGLAVAHKIVYAKYAAGPSQVFFAEARGFAPDAVVMTTGDILIMVRFAAAVTFHGKPVFTAFHYG
jgi:hypothetical protein